MATFTIRTFVNTGDPETDGYVTRTIDADNEKVAQAYVARSGDVNTELVDDTEADTEPTEGE